MSDLPSTGRQLRTEVTSAGELKLNLVDVPTAAPKPEQVVVRVEASPINPSDLGLLLGMAIPNSSPRSEGFIGEASTRTTTCSGFGAAVGTSTRFNLSSPAEVTSVRS